MKAILAALVVSTAWAAAPEERKFSLADGLAMEFIVVPSGKFHMGSPDTEAGRAGDEGPVHDVTISRPFLLGKYEVTQAQWCAVMGDNPSTFQDFATSATHPVEGVSWVDAQAFLQRLNTRGAGRFRLPTEAEWEYAARAGTTTRFPWGEDNDYRELPRHAWFYSRAEGRSHPVGGKQANAWGLYDLHGGVWEWCEDWFGSYPGESVTDPRGPATGTHRCIRGGSWFNEPEALRSANRHRHPPDSRQTNLGLRLVWEPAELVSTKPRRADGTVPYGYRAMADARTDPWHVAVTNHRAVAAGEHPRLMFRPDDLPALRAKAATPEGRAILQRLRLLLDGGDGERMTAHFNPATRAYSGQDGNFPPGTYTIGHAAGYGLLYQLTGDRKFAEFGRECFERALAGTRDRDDRYSYRQPGGALRAGPTLGWMAVGYDLCYDGWDEATRVRLGQALLDYREQMEGQRAEKQVIDLEHLVRGSMPPYSNHFGMQVGGGTLVLLALTGETGFDQPRLDSLLRDAEHSLVRNLSEGFGDGGFFAEGDGTGSMASQIVFLTALQAWRNVMGRDFISGPRPNARMLTLKWIYQTVFREGRPDFWPVRGGYPQNVWARSGQSGAGYFALGFGGVREEERTALQWCYEHFLAAADNANGTPYDTASLDPHFAAAAFVNWPVGLGAENPARILPHAYRDAVAGFYCWRNRWQDGDDTVITVLTNETRGYMGAKADGALAINSRGRHFLWGTLGAEGAPLHWSMSTRGETSALTLADGTAFGVDISGASGVDVMLVTSGRAEGQAVQIGTATLTFFFPTTDRPPRVFADGDGAVVGRQRVTLAKDQIGFAIRGR